jgi:hypothetical protein
MSRFKEGYRRFLQGKPGRRFRDLHAFRKKAEAGKIRLVRILILLLGFVLIAVGGILIVIPGPGLTLTAIGLMLLALESRIMASLLDRAEPLLWKWWPHLRRFWNRLPGAARWAVIIAVVAGSGALGWLSLRPWLPDGLLRHLPSWLS